MPDELPPLACTVRACGLRLHRAGRSLACPAGHSYDIARGGYVNLLQPQDRRSAQAGDQPEATHARARLLDAGVGRSLLDAVADRAIRAGASASRQPPVVADLGCGSGHLLGLASQRDPVQGVGFDLSVAAVQDAARRWPHVTWVVANVDRALPLTNGSVDIICSVHARRNPAECARALVADGTLLVARPAADDLVELRSRIAASASPRPPDERLVAEHAPWFDLVERIESRERHTLERQELLDLLRATYRGERRSAAERVAALARLDVTLVGEIFVFRSRVTPARTSRRAATTSHRRSTSSSATGARTQGTPHESRTCSTPFRIR